MQNPQEIKNYFTGQDAAFELFTIIREYIESLGPAEIEIMKTQISFGTKRKFAWVWLPQKWVGNRPEDSITLTFTWPEKISDSRIAEAVEASPGKWTHHIVIEKADQFDDVVKGWLSHAYARSIS